MHLIRIAKVVTCALALVGFVRDAGAQAKSTGTEVFFSQVYDYNQVNAKNNPHSIDKKMATFIDAARSTLDAALFEIHNDNVVAALIRAHQRGVKVRLASDYQYRVLTPTRSHQCPQYPALEAAGVPIVYDTKTSLMHNKFIIRDKKCVWTGSFNSVDSEAWENHNNAIKICNTTLAANYTAEFEEMFVAKQFGLGSPRNTTTAPIRISRYMTVETCFAPEDYCGRLVVNKILTAQKSIHVMAFSLTDFIPNGPEALKVRKTLPTIKSALLARRAAGVQVYGVLEHKKVNAPGSLVPDMLAAGMQVRADSNPGILHSKVFIIDGKTTIIGSFNFSGEADAGNDENMVVVNNTTVANAYLGEFGRLWQASKEVPPPRSCDPTKPININTATQTVLGTLPGMGWVGTQNIVRGRNYASVDELYTKGVLTANQLAAIRACLTVGTPAVGQPSTPR